MKAISQPPAGAVSHRPLVYTLGAMAVPDMLPYEPVSADQ
jgi:hypothetical protein